MTRLGSVKHLTKLIQTLLVNRVDQHPGLKTFKNNSIEMFPLGVLNFQKHFLTSYNLFFYISLFGDCRKIEEMVLFRSGVINSFFPY